jgi:hypothetical protein
MMSAKSLPHCKERGGGSKAAVDVIAHSRGGLVTRWWLEVMEAELAGPRRAVLVGCPLDGTSLATPKRLRDALSWLTNVQHAIETATWLASTAIPFLSVASGLLRISATVTSEVAKTPTVDAAVSLIPGLSAMTRVNLELVRLNVNLPKRPEYFAVVSDFDPAPTGLAAWRFITKAKTRAANAAADLLFQGKNDLIVDTESMNVPTLLGQGPSACSRLDGKQARRRVSHQGLEASALFLDGGFLLGRSGSTGIAPSMPQRHCN